MTDDKSAKRKKNADKIKYTPSPFSFCDYRCDRCEFQDTCKVYKDEQERLLEHYVKGEDPHDPDVFMNDMKDIFDQTKQMILGFAQKEGFDLDNTDDVEVPHIDPNEYKLYRLVRAYADEAHVFLKLLQREGISDEIEEAYDDLMWYHTLIVAKTGRLVSTFEDDARDAEMQAMEETGTLRVIEKCIRISRAGLETMLRELPEYLQDVAELISMLNRVEEQIDKDIRQKVGS